MHYVCAKYCNDPVPITTYKLFKRLYYLSILRECSIRSTDPSRFQIEIKHI